MKAKVKKPLKNASPDVVLGFGWFGEAIRDGHRSSWVKWRVYVEHPVPRVWRTVFGVTGTGGHQFFTLCDVQLGGPCHNSPEYAKHQCRLIGMMFVRALERVGLKSEKAKRKR